MKPNPHFTIAELGLIDFWNALNDELWLLNQPGASEREALIFAGHDFSPERCADLLVIYRTIEAGIARMVRETA
jgi:hypothetical protein